MKKILFFLILFSNRLYSQVSSDINPTSKHPVSNKPQHDPPEIVNSYTEAVSFNKCNNVITVTDGSLFNIGDTVLLIQMKGALIDTSNTAAFGTIRDYKSAGNYEFNYISQKSGNELTLKNNLTKSYDIPAGIVQLIRVPYFTDPVFTGGLTCMRWDGTKGGVLAIITSNSLTCYTDIDVSGKGFRGGEGYNANLPPSNCFENNYYYPETSQLAAFKGESIASISQNMTKGKGNLASGGGGGLSHNSGGGGGANAGDGGYGGYQSDTCGNAPFDNRGIAGKKLLYNSVADKIFMGGGGGAGHADNSDFNALPTSGGRGGGIAIIIADSLYMKPYELISNGNDGQYCYSADCNDGMGGGGGGGTILLSVKKIIDTLTIQTTGGNGASINSTISPGGRVGPGGGGGAGAFYINSSFLPANTALINNGGFNGILALNAANPWGATKGTDGLSFFNLALPFDTVLFKANIDSVRIRDSLITCNSFQFNGVGFTNTNPILSWYWNFGDGNIAVTQNAVHSYLSETGFPVKLIVTDTNGCEDSVTIVVDPKIILIDAGENRSFCSNGPVSVTLNATGTGIYAWSPVGYLNDPAQQNPVAIIDSTITFHLAITKNNCTVFDSVKIIVNPAPILSISKSNDINCNLPYAHLNVSGALQYRWSPASYLSNNTVFNPVANPVTTTTFIVAGTNSLNCSSKDSIEVYVDFGKSGFELPNSFTPNGDGLNDCFGIKYYRDVQNLSFIIYNRFGEKVFETTNAFDCWDGYCKGQPADPGTYVYYMQAKTLCGNVIKKGTILLIR